MSDLVQGVALTLSEAAQAAGVSLSTIKRRRIGGGFPSAYQDSSGAWRIPVQDLIGAGLRISAPSQPDETPPGSLTQASPTTTQVTEPDHDSHELARAAAIIDRLTVELADARAARQVAEARADAYGRNLEDLRLALRAIAGRPEDAPATPPGEPTTAAPVTQEPAREPQKPLEPQTATPRRRWWHNLTGR